MTHIRSLKIEFSFHKRLGELFSKPDEAFQFVQKRVNLGLAGKKSLSDDLFYFFAFVAMKDGRVDQCHEILKQGLEIFPDSNLLMVDLVYWLWFYSRSDTKAEELATLMGAINIQNVNSDVRGSIESVCDAIIATQDVRFDHLKTRALEMLDESKRYPPKW